MNFPSGDAPEGSEVETQEDDNWVKARLLLDTVEDHELLDPTLTAEEILYRTVAAEKKNGSNIFVLEYHVDYWNRLGWKDPFSKNQFTKRQNNYSSVLQQRELYTPQMIVNGETEFVGKDVRWYYAKDVQGELVYATSGNKVPRSDGAKPIMVLSGRRTPRLMRTSIDGSMSSMAGAAGRATGADAAASLRTVPK